jgi:hypothetical protein
MLLSEMPADLLYHDSIYFVRLYLIRAISDETWCHPALSRLEQNR